MGRVIDMRYASVSDTSLSELVAMVAVPHTARMPPNTNATGQMAFTARPNTPGRAGP